MIKTLLLWKVHNQVKLEGEIGSCLYIIQEGEVDCISQGKVVRTLKKGDCFGERCILIDNVRTMNVITKCSCVIYSVSQETLRTMVGDRYRDVLFLNFIKVSFGKSKYLKNLDIKMIDKIYEKFQILNFDKNKTVLNKGYNLSSKIIVIIEGSLINVRMY